MNNSEILNAQSTPAWNALYDAHVLFIKELAIVNQSFCVYRVVGINTRLLRGPGAEFIRFSSMLAQRNFVIGITSLFERKDVGAGLCSIRGLLSLAEALPLTSPAAHVEFVSKYGLVATGDWKADVQAVLKTAAPIAQKCLNITKKIRNTRVAHLAQPQPDSTNAQLPSIDDSERIIHLAYDFYLFIACGFLQSVGAQLEDHAGSSLLQMMRKRFELPDAKYDLPI